MPDGSRVRGCDEQDGLTAPDVAPCVLAEGFVRQPGRFGMPSLQGIV